MFLIKLVIVIYVFHVAFLLCWYILWLIWLRIWGEENYKFNMSKQIPDMKQ